MSSENKEEILHENEENNAQDVQDATQEAQNEPAAAEDIATEPDTMGSFDNNGDAAEFINSGGDPLELNQSNESLIARHKTKLSSEFVSAWTQEDVNDNLTIECSLQQDMEWANESENIQ